MPRPPRKPNARKLALRQIETAENLINRLQAGLTASNELETKRALNHVKSASKLINKMSSLDFALLDVLGIKVNVVE